MNKQAKRTKPLWGVVAVIGVMVACTVEGSLIITAIAAAVFGIGAYMGGYMDASTGSATEKGGAA